MQLWKATQAMAPPSVNEASALAVEAERARCDEERAKEREKWEAEHADLLAQHAAAMHALESAKRREAEMLEGGGGSNVEQQLRAQLSQVQSLHMQQTLALH